MIIKKIRAWFNKPMFRDSELVVEPPESLTGEEPQEIWQWQINCVSVRHTYYKPMPQNFGLLIGTREDAEARLKASVSLPNYWMSKTYPFGDTVTYEFSDVDDDRSSMDILVQRGAIRPVSKNMMLIRTGNPFYDTPFIVGIKDCNRDFNFHPIKPQEQFIKGERTSVSEP